ncbi:MAG: cytochrome C, partial [Rhodospirillaceae bacterium]|nr:cytochrome C [Rhodospirillaceae bacterium]
MPRLSNAFVAGILSCLLVPATALSQSPNWSAKLPDGTGKEAVEGTCLSCHPANRITRSSGYTPAHWKELMGTMVDLSANKAVQGKITRYLAAHFPPSRKRAPRLIKGDAQISFKEWVAPTLGQRSRDPIQAKNGSIWWAGQWGNLVGRINPATGEMKEYPLPDKAMPHSVTLDRAGNVWYTGNKNGTVSKLDPKTGKITEYKMPDPRARDPHTAIFDKNGTLWFTLQHSNMIGRLNPATGAIKLVTPKTPKSKPYGIKIDADGVPW